MAGLHDALLQRAQQLAPFDFEILAFHHGSESSGFIRKINSYLATTGAEYAIEKRDAYTL